MTNQFANYVPIQGLLGVTAPPGINPTESMSQSVAISITVDGNPSNSMSESVSVIVS